MQRRTLLQTGAAVFVRAAKVPAKVVVLTFDDAVKSHRSFVAPLLKELGFAATFFVTHRWMDDSEYFMNWRDIGAIHEMGFEIGNHSWTHADFSVPRNAARLAGELALVENELKKVNVPRPVSFAYSGNFFGPEAVEELRRSGYRLARRGESPEAEYGTLQLGPTFDPRRHDRLLIPTTGDAYPNWTLEHFIRVVSHGGAGQAVVLQFHGVPDVKHPWVHTPPENFRQYMAYLKDHDYRVIALRDLEQYIDSENPPADPKVRTRYRPRKQSTLLLPVEMTATRADHRYWLENMLGPHQYSRREAAQVLGWNENDAAAAGKSVAPPQGSGARVLPYPGGRPLRIGFRDGAIDPLRGTKASVFLPWSPQAYVVIDLPEAIFSNLGLLFLAHTHIPTVWNEQNKIIENVDWERPPEGGLRSSWLLSNSIGFGAVVAPHGDEMRMELWLRNGSEEPLSRLRTQICVLLKGAPDFHEQTNANKIFGKAAAGVRSRTGDQWILTEWERCGRTWGNAQCPCVHSDPVLPDCAPGETVRVTGRLWFVEGERPGIV
ncbi:MAG: polysaccharide deacetylase family protein [Bryobacteraceae bacterium]